MITSTNLFRTELLWGGKILSIVVSQMVVAYDRHRLDTGRNQKIDQHGFQLRLTGLEIIASDECTMMFS